MPTVAPAPRIIALAARHALAVAILLAAFAEPTQATSLKDLQVGVRGIEFLTAPPRGQTQVAIIHDPQNKESQQDARAIIGWLNASIRGTKTELMPNLVDINELDNTPAVSIAIIASGMSANFSRIQSFAQKNGTLTITADLACVRSSACVLGVATEPNVEIALSREASAASRVDFVRAFRMMVKEY